MPFVLPDTRIIRYTSDSRNGDLKNTEFKLGVYVDIMTDALLDWHFKFCCANFTHCVPYLTGLSNSLSYPQSGAGHQRQSGSATSHLLSMNSSYFSMRARSPRINWMSWGLKRSEHSGQQMFTRDSEISMRRYCRRQSAQERWWQVMMSGKRSRAWRSRHRGHSSSSEEEPDTDEVEAAPSTAWAEVLSWEVSGWTLSVLITRSTGAPACRGLDFRLGSRSGRQRRPKIEWRDRRRLLGGFLAEGRLTEEAAE